MMFRAPTGEWRRASAIEATEYAARVHLYASKVRMMHRCRCDSGPCNNAPEGSVLGKIPNQCPIGWSRNPHFGAVAYLTRCLDAGPVAGWPDAYADGIVSGVLTLRAERSKWEADQIKGA